MYRKRRVLGSKSKEFIEGYLNDRKDLMEQSPRRVLARILERLGKSDPEIQTILNAYKQARTGREISFLRRPKVPVTLQREDIPGIPLSDEERFGDFFPRLVSLRAYVEDPGLLLSEPAELLRSSLLMGTLDPLYPRWATVFESNPERSHWFQWTRRPRSEVLCISGLRGAGVLEDDQVTNTATWAWDFGAVATEPVDIWFQNFARGPCVWDSNDGDVSLWVLFEASVEKWIPPESGSGWETSVEVAKLEAQISRLWSTNPSLALDGPPPHPYLAPGSPEGAIPIHPQENNHIRVQVEAGYSYTVYSAVTVALTANEEAAIALGSLGGAYFQPCTVRGLCFICRLG
jgi:hypothetical protein